MHLEQIKKIVKEAERAFYHELDIVKEVLGCHHPNDPRRLKVRQVLLSFFHNQNFIVMDLSVPQGIEAPIILGLVDATTLAPITATKANETETSDTPAVAIVDASGNLEGVSPGSFNLISEADWTYTDSNTGQQVTTHEKTVTPGTVTAVITAESVTQVVSLGTPVTIPAAPVVAPVTTP